MADVLGVDRIARAVDPRKLGPGGLAQLVATLDLLSGADSTLRLADVRTETLVALLARASQAQLDAIATTQRTRSLVLTEVFRRMGEHLRPGRATGVLRWRIEADGELERFQTVIAAGTCVTGTDLSAPPDVTLTMSMADFLRLVTGVDGVLALLLRRRLRIRGDLRRAVRLARRFDIPGR